MSVRAAAGELATEATVVGHDGRRRRARLGADEQVAAWAELLHVGAPGLVEFVCALRHPDGRLAMRSRRERSHYPGAGDTAALVALARRQRELGDELFATPLTRARPRPGLDGGVLPGRVAWVDIDEPAGLELLRSFEHRPRLVARSGSGGAHAYWRLAEALAPGQLEAVNRRLAGALGGDLASCDRARIMRLPGSWNGKADRPCRIAYLDQAARPIAATALAAGLEDPAPPPPPPDQATVRRRLAWLADDPVASVPPPAYFRALAGIEVPERGGLVLCPFHDERLPSLMVYATPERGWRCYGGCGLGGTAYDLASLLDGGPSGRALRGEDFKRVRERVHEALGLSAPDAAPRRNET